MMILSNDDQRMIVKVVKTRAQMVEAAPGARSPTAERCPACRLGRLAMACKVVAADRTDRSRRLNKGPPLADTAKRRTDLLGRD